MIRAEVLRFLLAGGTASAINWLARIGLSVALPFEAATIVAYVIGMIAGFWLYRRFVFRGATHGSARGQLPVFLAVNVFGLGVVVIVSTLSLALLSGLLPTLDPSLTEALGHGVGVAAGAVANYCGHRLLTFGAGRRRTSTAHPR